MNDRLNDTIAMTAAFSTFKTSAFRLETLDKYTVENEDSSFADYLDGEFLAPTDGEHQAWKTLVETNVSAGKSMQRVHIIPKKLTPYLRYEIEWWYLHNAAAGEEIYLIDEQKAASIVSRTSGDFWFFDRRIAFFIIYDDNGKFLEVEKKTDPTTLAVCASVQQDLIVTATPLRQYLQQIRSI